MSNHRANQSSGPHRSPVNRMFDGQSVFITGASGFIGRVLLEKLLRSYEGIKRIYILLRPKKSLAPKERLHKHLLNVPIFDRIRSQPDGQHLLDKIHIIEGDIGEPRLGISDHDYQQLLADPSLSVVFHSAATVKFDEPLKQSVRFNLVATKIVLEFCKQLGPRLRCLCHVSTAYVNSDIKDLSPIEERLYPIRQDPEDLIRLSEILDEQTMQALKPVLLAERPNTYTYTKALAEHLIARQASELPVAIVRPSIVVAAWEEPLKGWVDNLNGPTGLLLAAGKGLLRSMYATRSVVADIIPVDVCVNTMIAAAYYTANDHNKVPGATNSEQQQQQEEGGANDDDEDATPKRENKIFHCSSGDVNPITWGQTEPMFFKALRHYPSQSVLRYPFGSFKSNRYHDLVTRLFVHLLPALFIDLICLVMGKKRQMVSIYGKLQAAVESLTHFATTQYNFKCRNLRLLEACLTDELDRRQLRLHIRSLNWTDFWDKYMLGVRRYILKEPDETLEESRKSFRRAYYIEMAFRAILVLLACLVVVPLVMRTLPTTTLVAATTTTTTATATLSELR